MQPVLKINVDKEKPLVLLAPLDWGLGHTTRIIPIAKELVKLSCKTLIACNSRQKTILQAELPDCEFLDLEGYDICYGRTRMGTTLCLLFQIPKILRLIRQEHKWLQQLVMKLPIDLVISDNRYGLYSQNTKTVFLSHQLSPRSGLSPFIDKWSNKFLNRRVNNFNEVWIPDQGGVDSISGELSNAIYLNNKVTHIGPLSRMESCDKREEKNRVLVLLSGPEPQRTILEELVYHQCITENGITIIRGVPSSSNTLSARKEITVHNYLSAVALNEEICRAEYIVCRSGYSSLMDLLPLQKKLITIPTPGQPEQEYLARYLSQKRMVLNFRQSGFDLAFALKKASTFDYRFVQYNTSGFKEFVHRIVADLLKAQKNSGLVNQPGV